MGHLRQLFQMLLPVWLALALPAMAGKAGDLVFADRAPWDLSQGPLVWQLQHHGPTVETFRPLGDGRLTLSPTTDPRDGKPMLELAEKTAQIQRKLGLYPVSGGDPVLTFFLESTARDMAALTGGSPYYIRNRLKEALFGAGRVEEQGDIRVVTFTPFAQDRNRDRMYGFETLKLSFTLDDPKQPIRHLRAETGPLAGGRPAYSNDLVLQ